MVHVEDYKLWTICEHVQKNPYLAKHHLKKSHRVEYDANSQNIAILLTSLRSDLFGAIEVKSNGTEVENSTIKAAQ